MYNCLCVAKCVNSCFFVWPIVGSWQSEREFSINNVNCCSEIIANDLCDFLFIRLKQMMVRGTKKILKSAVPNITTKAHFQRVWGNSGNGPVRTTLWIHPCQRITLNTHNINSLYSIESSESSANTKWPDWNCKSTSVWRERVTLWPKESSVDIRMRWLQSERLK